MRSIVMLLVVFMSVFCSSLLADFQYPQNGGEYRLMITARNSMGPYAGQFELHNTEGLPPAVLNDVLELTQAIDAIPISPRSRSVVTSSDGTSVFIVDISQRLFEDTYDQETPSGVWIFPDWRDANTVRHYPNYSRARFLNGKYLMLIQDRPGDRNTVIVDVADNTGGTPIGPWQVHGMWRYSINVGRNGFWAAAKKSNKLHVGQLGSDDSIAAGYTVTSMPDINNVMITRDGTFLILETKDGNLLTVKTETMEITDTHIGKFNVMGDIEKTLTISSNMFVAWDSVQQRYDVYSVNELGDMEIVPILEMNMNAEWFLGSWSPTGAYAEGKKYVEPVGALEFTQLRTSFADPNQEGVPPVCGCKADTDMCGWLYWD